METIAVNRKEYFEKYRNREINEKRKGLRKDTAGKSFEENTQRIQKRFQVKNTEMQMATVKKKQFAGLNDKQFYFYDGIVSLPFVHPFLYEVKKEGKHLKKNIHQVINEKKIDLLKT